MDPLGLLPVILRSSKVGVGSRLNTSHLEGEPMPLFLCRWPNGDCSAVLARNEQDALIKLDEVSNAEGCPLVQLNDFQVHFHLTEDGELMLERLGEATEDAIWEFCYPVLDEAKGEIQEEQDALDDSTLTPEQARRVRGAVRQERERVRAAPVEEPETELGRDIKKQMGAPTALVDEIVRQGGEETLRKLKPPRKPH